MDALEIAETFCAHDKEDPPCPVCIANGFIVIRKIREDFKKESIVPVVVACIVDVPKRELLLHRKVEAVDEKGISRNPELCGRWEFPGGMMEYGEDPIDALRREIEEELGREIVVVSLFHARTNIFKDNVHYLILYYLCTLYADATLSRDGIKDSQWNSLDALRKLDVIPGTVEVAEKVIEIIEKRSR